MKFTNLFTTFTLIVFSNVTFSCEEPDYALMKEVKSFLEQNHGGNESTIAEMINGHAIDIYIFQR